MTDDKDHGAGLIHPAIPDVAGTEPRLTIDGDKIYKDAQAFCYGVASEALKPYNQFSTRERMIVDAMAEWMGSRDCQIARLWSVLNRLVAEADTCACTHDDENCCAKAGETCVVCLVAMALGEAEGRA